MKYLGEGTKVDIFDMFNFLASEIERLSQDPDYKS